MEKKEEVYKQRQALVEHPYGTMKRQWGFDHAMTKQYKERASADIGLIMSAYNLRRIFNILTIKELVEYFAKKGQKVFKWQQKARWKIRMEKENYLQKLDLILGKPCRHHISLNLAVCF